MANVDNARGFWPVRHLHGGPIVANPYVVKTGETIYQGDAVTIDATGTVLASAANDGIKVLGVAAGYVTDAASAGGKEVLVYDDPLIVFGVQADSGTAVAATEVFATANHVAGSGSSTTKLSGHELDSSDIGTGSQLRILRKISDPNNDWGEHVDLEVLFVEHALKDTTTI